MRKQAADVQIAQDRSHRLATHHGEYDAEIAERDVRLLHRRHSQAHLAYHVPYRDHCSVESVLGVYHEMPHKSRHHDQRADALSDWNRRKGECDGAVAAVETGYAKWG